MTSSREKRNTSAAKEEDRHPLLLILEEIEGIRNPSEKVRDQARKKGKDQGRRIENKAIRIQSLHISSRNCINSIMSKISQES